MAESALEKRVDRLEDEVRDIRSNSSNLEELLGLFIVHTDRALTRLEKEMRDFKDEMRDFKDQMRDFKDEMLEFKNEMSEFKDDMRDFKDEMRSFKDEMRDFKDEMRDFKDEMRDFKDEMCLWREEVDKDRRALNRKWGELANKMGTIVEDIVAPSVPTIAKEYFDCPELEDFMIRRWRRKPSDPSQRREFDCIAVCQNKVLMVEVKSRVKQSYLEEFDEFVKRGEFFEYFPEMKEKVLIPIFASLYIPEEAVAYLTNRKLYAMGMKDDVMDILNPDL